MPIYKCEPRAIEQNARTPSADNVLDQLKILWLIKKQIKIKNYDY